MRREVGCWAGWSQKMPLPTSPQPSLLSEAFRFREPALMLSYTREETGSKTRAEVIVLIFCGSSSTL